MTAPTSDIVIARNPWHSKLTRSGLQRIAKQTADQLAADLGQLMAQSATKGKPFVRLEFLAPMDMETAVIMTAGPGKRHDRILTVRNNRVRLDHGRDLVMVLGRGLGPNQLATLAVNAVDRFCRARDGLILLHPQAQQYAWVTSTP